MGFKDSMKIGRHKKGQSFVELSLVLAIILLLLAGVVEFGNLFNQYINVVDGAREGARFGSNDDPFSDVEFYDKIDQVIENSAMTPITLDPTKDDLVVSVFSVTGNVPVRFPLDKQNGWQKYGNHVSRFLTSDIGPLLDSSAPNTGLVLVELFYNYNQILKLPFFTAVVPDPILVHSYSVMPLSSAEPTPTP